MFVLFLAFLLTSCYSQSSPCLQLGQWTGYIKNTQGQYYPLYDSYYIFEDDFTGLSVIAGAGPSWGSGIFICGGLLSVTVVLDNDTTVNGTYYQNGTQIDWDNGSRWVLQQVNTVHVVFMNHLDVGYNGIPQTGFINNVLNTYFGSHFPRALRLQSALRAAKIPERFVYTTHPWLVSFFLNCPALTLSGVTLQCPSSDLVSEFIDAVDRGDITWHAGPFNLQPENMDASLFEFGLSMARDLDAMFNITRPFGVLSQRDVPGMTRGVIPLLVQNNVQAITVGQNQDTPPVDVPKLYRWREPTSGAEIIGINHAFGYGGIDRVDDPISSNGIALAYAFRTDNSGPPTSIQEFLNIYSSIRGQYPGATIKASTFENFVSDILPVMDTLPLIEDEIGDVWIDGIASDPLKEIQFREISRARSDCLNSGNCDPNDARIKDMSRYLIKIPEHTWGLPGVYDSENWRNDLFKKAKSGKNYQNCVSAWYEQRYFNQLAIQALKDHPLAQMITNRLAALKPTIPSTAGMTKLNKLDTNLTCGKTVVQFDGTAGSIVYFFDGKTVWADYTRAQSQLFNLVYSTFNESDFQFMATYYGSNAGYDKYNSSCNEPGCANPKDAKWPNTMSELWWNSATCSGVVKLESPAEANSYYGAPTFSYFSFNIIQNSDGATINMTVVLWNKTSTRLPEQLMLEFLPNGFLAWEMDKLGSWVSPLEVILNGSQYQHAVWTGIRGIPQSGNGILTILTPDAPLVAPITFEKPFPGWSGTPTAMPVPTTPLNLNGAKVYGMAINFFNNVWDTNYILWYPYLDNSGDENLMFRVVLTTSNF